MASGGGLTVGPNLTYGDGSHPGSVHTVGANPSGIAAAPRVGMQFGASGGVGYEIGDVADIIDTANEITDLLDDDDLSLSDAQEQIERLQDFLVDLGRDGRGKLHIQGTIPLIVGRADAGWAIGLELGGEAHFGFSILDDELRYVSERREVQSKTSAYLKGAEITRIALLPSFQVADWGERGLFVGARVNHYNTEMMRTVIALEDTDQDFGDMVLDEVDRQRESSTAIGIDLGVTYQSSVFKSGLTWLNVNEPTFDFPEVGVNCSQITDEALQTNCYTAQSFGDRIPLEETWTLNEQARAEFALHDPGQRFVLAASYDLNSVRDVSGDEYQWLALSASYRLPWFLSWIPDMRLGYRENQVGSELSYYSAGLTWLGVLNLDAAVSEQTIDHEGDSVPRSAMINLGLQVRF
nr:conjugal transfer protein TraF [Halorhodospira halochloris]